jgi:hypothetical protein
MLAKTKPAPTLTERIRHAADKVRAVDAEIKDVIEAWLDEQKESQAGQSLPRETFRKMLIGKYAQPWFAILGLEAERGAHE